jgi:hypothetical protein
MVNTNMFRHPKYYKELRKLRNKEARRVPGCLPTNELHNSDQAISKESSTDENQRASGPGLKPQAASSKPQATDPQAASDKLQAPSNKRQASSRKRQAP